VWDLIKNDPILKAISIFILGIFAFSFAFSIMFGSGQGAMEHGVTSGGINVVNSLGQIITLLSKLLIIILLVGIIIAFVKFIQKHIVGNESIKTMDSLKNKPLSAILLGTAGMLILLFMISMILQPNSSNNMMSPAINYSYNNYGFGIASILVSVLKLITAISFIGLLVGLVMHFKSQYFTNVKSIDANIVSKVICSECGLELKDNWKCCPNCGAEKYNKEENSEYEFKITLADNEEK